MAKPNELRKCVNRGIKLMKYDYVTTNPMLTGGHLPFAQGLLCAT